MGKRKSDDFDDDSRPRVLSAKAVALNKRYARQAFDHDVINLCHTIQVLRKQLKALKGTATKPTS